MTTPSPLDRLRELEKRIPERLWAVIDRDSGGVVIAAGWPEACHEHINEAIADDIDGAGRWVVREYIIDRVRSKHP